jgi:glycosyltransferase involved in cell wall biosynthesis
MRVLLLHNRYRALGGEERTVADIGALLRSRGQEVLLLERSSEELEQARVRGARVGRLRAAQALIRGGLDEHEVGDAVRRIGADVVHVHNIHPLFGWRALAAARAAGAATILHLHNFRLFCAIAVAYRDGTPCFRCRGRDTLPGLRLRCRGSVPEAAVYALGLHRQQPLLFEHADRFVVVSRAHGARLHELGLPSGRSETLPNFVPATRFAAHSRAGDGEYALVSGRLVEEKGFDTAILAARKAGVPLRVAGAGPDEPRLRRLAAGGEVTFCGLLEPDELADVRRNAAVVLAPSRSDEACPYSVLDAHAAGVPVLASERGGLPELVGGEATLPAEDPDAWTTAVGEVWGDRARRQALGEECLERARERFGEERYYERLIALYEDVAAAG